MKKMKGLLILLILTSLTLGSRIASDAEDVELVDTSSKVGTSYGEAAVVPAVPATATNSNTRKMSNAFKTFLRIVNSSLLTPTTGTQAAAVRSPVAAPIMNPAIPPGINPIAGVNAGPQSVFFPPIRIGVDQASQLYIPPGSDGRIIVQLKNDGIGDLFFVSGADDKNFFLQFDQSAIQLGNGQTIAVTGRIRVPPYANNMVSTLTVIVQRRTDNVISQRRILIRTKSETGEKWAPWCTIKTATKCDSYLNEAICANRYWNMRAEIQDTDSGLLSVTIKPDGRFLGEDFPVGTNDSVAIEQTVSCCTTGVDITAVDVRGNIVTCRADQYTIYLTTGDIVAIVLGVILLILIIIILIIVICRCCKRRRSVNTAPPPRSKKADQA